MSKNLLSLFLLIMLLVPAAAQDQDAQELLVCAQANWSSSTFHGVLSIKTFRPEFSREFRLEVWSTADNEQAMIRTLEPQDEAGSGYLLLDDELWFYTPQAGQVISLPGASLGEAFFGSDVAVEDLYRGTIGERYTAQVLGTRSDEEGRLIHRLRLVPLPEADVVYGRLELDLLDGSCAVLQIDFFDQRDTLIREAVYSDLVEVNGLTFALRSVVTDLLREQSYTEELVESYEIGVDIPQARFTLECLQDEAQCG
ncbi:MAG TPA: outer membrane lipoprotein-sorting protein [Candidatus Bipolaricaulota bacterium]